MKGRILCLAIEGTDT